MPPHFILFFTSLNQDLFASCVKTMFELPHSWSSQAEVSEHIFVIRSYANLSLTCHWLFQEEEEPDSSDDDSEDEEEPMEEEVDQNFRLELMKVLQNQNALVGFQQLLMPSGLCALHYTFIK